MQELTAASGKQLDDYTLERVQDDEEAYLSAGYSQAEAETIASQSLMIPQDSQVKQLKMMLLNFDSTKNVIQRLIAVYKKGNVDSIYACM